MPIQLIQAITTRPLSRGSGLGTPGNIGRDSLQ